MISTLHFNGKTYKTKPKNFGMISNRGVSLTSRINLTNFTKPKKPKDYSWKLNVRKIPISPGKTFNRKKKMLSIQNGKSID